MVSRKPLYGDSADEPRELDSAVGDTVEAAVLPDATTSTKGALTAADKTKLDGIASGAQNNTASNLTPTDRAGGVGPFSAKVSSDLQFKPQVGGLGHHIEQVGNDVVHSAEFPQLQPRWAQRDALAERRTRCRWQAPAQAYAPTLHGPNPSGPYIEHLFPFDCASRHDYEGFPHDRDGRLEANLSSGNDSGVRGYDDGEFIPKGETARLLGITYSGVGVILNTTDRDTFFEFVLEPNPTCGTTLCSGVNVATTQASRKYTLASGTWASKQIAVGQSLVIAGFAQSSSNGTKTVESFSGADLIVAEAIGTDEASASGRTFYGARYAGTNRMRMLSGELGLLLASERRFEFEIDLAFTGEASCSFRGRFEIYGASGDLIWSARRGGVVTSGFNWMLNDALLQLRWRVDRIANVDIYAATYQDPTKAKLRVDEWGYRPRWRQ